MSYVMSLHLPCLPLHLPLHVAGQGPPKKDNRQRGGRCGVLAGEGGQGVRLGVAGDQSMDSHDVLIIIISQWTPMMS